MTLFYLNSMRDHRQLYKQYCGLHTFPPGIIDTPPPELVVPIPSCVQGRPSFPTTPLQSNPTLRNFLIKGYHEQVHGKAVPHLAEKLSLGKSILLRHVKGNHSTFVERKKVQIMRFQEGVHQTKTFECLQSDPLF